MARRQWRRGGAEEATDAPPASHSHLEERDAVVLAAQLRAEVGCEDALARGAAGDGGGGDVEIVAMGHLLKPGTGSSGTVLCMHAALRALTVIVRRRWLFFAARCSTTSCTQTRGD